MACGSGPQRRGRRRGGGEGGVLLGLYSYDARYIEGASDPHPFSLEELSLSPVAVHILFWNLPRTQGSSLCFLAS